MLDKGSTRHGRGQVTHGEGVREEQQRSRALTRAGGEAAENVEAKVSHAEQCGGSAEQSTTHEWSGIPW